MSSHFCQICEMQLHHLFNKMKFEMMGVRGAVPVWRRCCSARSTTRGIEPSNPRLLSSSSDSSRGVANNDAPLCDPASFVSLQMRVQNKLPLTTCPIEMFTSCEGSTRDFARASRKMYFTASLTPSLLTAAIFTMPHKPCSRPNSSS